MLVDSKRNFRHSAMVTVNCCKHSPAFSLVDVTVSLAIMTPAARDACSTSRDSLNLLAPQPYLEKD